MVRTGAHVYSKFDFESTFGGDDSTKTKVFGLSEELSPITTTNNQIPLSQLNSIEVDQFAYGQDSKKVSLAFVLSSPWWLELILNNRVDAGTSPYTHTYTGLKTVKSFAWEIGFASETSNTVRTLLGCCINSATIRCSQNDVIRCTADVVCGKEGTISTTLDSSPPSDSYDFPFTFVHGLIQLPSGTTIAQVQSAEISIGQNVTLVYGFNSKEAVGAFRGILDITGRFNAAMVDKTQLQRVLDRTEVATLVLKFSNGLSGTSEKTITLTGTGVGISEQTYTAKGVDPVFEDLTWQIRSLTAVATDNVATPP